jgi:hypothetical protein
MSNQEKDRNENIRRGVYSCLDHEDNAHNHGNSVEPAKLPHLMMLQHIFQSPSQAAYNCTSEGLCQR